jgi:uncharacterized protein (DUF1501 family)
VQVNRRQFMVGCSAAIAAMAGGRVGNLVFASEATSTPEDILVVVFLRGGCDGLSLVAPVNDPVYVAERGRIAVPSQGPNAALPIVSNNRSFETGLGLHPKAGPLKELYDARNMAIIHACGLDNDTRSHFEAMDYIERGTPGYRATPTGWLTRHLASSSGSTSDVPALSATATMPAALLGDRRAVALAPGTKPDITAPWRYRDTRLPNNMLDTARRLFGGRSVIDHAGSRTLDMIDALDGLRGTYTPEPGVIYPGGSFGDSLKLVAHTIKQDVGLRVSTVDFGGWDTHERQGEGGGGYFATQVDTLARGLHAFIHDLPHHAGRLTIVVMSEFGRRLGVNLSDGTDHGHGNMMLVIGGNVNGGKVYGQWPGLEDLDQNQDLRITTDYRTILSEILIRRLHNPQLGIVFPGFENYAPLGVVRGQDLPPIYDRADEQHRVLVPLVTR